MLVAIAVLPRPKLGVAVRFTPLFVVSCAVILIEHEKAWKQTVCVLVRVLYTISPSREYGLSRDRCLRCDFLGIS